LEFVIRVVVGRERLSWLADHKKAVGEALQQENILPGKHVTPDAYKAVEDRVCQLLLPEWELRSDPNAVPWLKGALKAIAPRLVALYRQKQGRQIKKETRDSGDDGKGSQKESDTAPSTPKATSSQPEKRTIPPKSKLSTTSFDSRTVPNENKRPRSMVANVKRHANIDEEERKHKLEGVDRNIYLRAMDRSIVVRIKDHEFPFVIGMHALLEEESLERGLDDLTHINMCWESFSRLLKLADDRYDPEYSEDGLEVKWTDPVSKAIRKIVDRSSFVRAIGVLGNFAGDRAYIEMTLS
jgi:hypothetical protein